MNRATRSSRSRIAVLGGLAIGVALSATLGAVAGDTQASTPEPSATAAGPVLALADCLRIAIDQQPALAAQRASLAAAIEGHRGLERLFVPSFIARDLPIRRQQACLGVAIA